MKDTKGTLPDMTEENEKPIRDRKGDLFVELKDGKSLWIENWATYTRNPNKNLFEVHFNRKQETRTKDVLVRRLFRKPTIKKVEYEVVWDEIIELSLNDVLKVQYQHGKERTE